jgi:hypothetical protein
MVQYLVNGWSPRWIIVQDPLNKVSCLISDGNSLWELIVVHPNLLVSCLNIIGLKWRFTNDQSVNDDSQRPNVYFIRVTLLSLKYLGSNIVGSTADSPLSLTIELKLGGKTEISNLDLHLVIKEEITQLEISMNNSVGVKVLDSIANLDYVTLHLQLMKPPPPSEQLIEGLTLAQLQDDVDVLSILEEVLKANDVGVMQGAVNLNLTHQLLFCSGLCQSSLIDNLGSRNSLSLHVCELVTFSESSLSQELASVIFLDADVSVKSDNFFFHDNLTVTHEITVDSLALRSCTHYL